MAEDTSGGGGASARPGSVAFEQEVTAKVIEAIEWWDPFTRYCLAFREVCTNCKTKLDPQAQAVNDDANSEGRRAAGKSGKGACSRCHRAYYCGPEVCVCVFIASGCRVESAYKMLRSSSIKRSLC